MPNVKKTTKRKSAPKKKTSTRTLRAVRETPPDTASHEETIVGLTDPFSPYASDTRYPDQGSGRTLVTQQRLMINLVADANGTLAYAFNPKPTKCGVQYTSIVGNVATWPANFSLGDFSADLLNTYGLSYRVTSMGIRVCNSLSATNSSGYLIIAKGGIPALGSTTQFNPVNFASFDIHSNVHGGEWCSTSHPRSAQGYDPDLVAAGIVTTYADDSWETIYLYANGLPASSVPYVCEVVLNFEYSAKEDAPIASIARQAPIMDVSIQTAVNHVQNNLPSSHANPQGKVSTLIRREAKKALIKHVLPFALKKAKQALL